MAFRISTLHARDVPRAYVLVERLIPGTALEGWTELTASAAQRRAWLVAKDLEGYVRGICHAVVRGDGDHRRQLEVPLIASVSLTEGKEITAALFRAAKAMAVREACPLVHVWTALPPDWTRLAEFLDHGPWEHGQLYGTSGDVMLDQPILPVKM